MVNQTPGSLRILPTNLTCTRSRPRVEVWFDFVVFAAIMRLFTSSAIDTVIEGVKTIEV